MSRKTTISSVQRAVTNKSFESFAVPYEQLDEEAEIKKALENNKIEGKERELLESELEKPYSQRNKALMNKYRGRIKEVLDGYPKDVSKGGYTITATAKDDPNVPMGKRPQPWFAKATIDNAGNTWIFKFPIQKESTGDGAEIYKLDGFNTWVYKDSSPVDSMGEDEVTPYIVLYKLTRGNPTLARKYLTGHVYNFNFPGFYVEYTRDSSRDVAKEKEEEKQQAKVKSTSQPFQVSDPFEVIEGTEAAAKNLLKDRTQIPIGQVPRLKETDVMVDKIGIGKTVSSYTWLYYEDIVDEVMFGVILNGSGVAARYLGIGAANIKQITAKIEKHNNTMVQKFQKIQNSYK